MNTQEFIEYNGKGVPVPEGTEVRCRFRNGWVTRTFDAHRITWDHNYRGRGESRVDIVAYQVVPKS